MLTMRSTRSALSAFAVGVCLMSNAASAQETITVRFASPLGEKMSFGEGATWWMNQISERTNDRVQWRSFFGGSLVAGGDVLPALSSGRVDAAMLAAVYNPGDFPLWSISTLPFLGDNAIAQMNAVYELYSTNATLQGEFEKQNIVMSLFQPVTPAAAGLREGPIDGPEGFSGKKLRAVGIMAEALTLLGVEPIAIGPGEIYESIERGVVDGYGGIGFDTIPDLSLQEVAPHAVNPRIGTYSSVGIGFNKAFWDGLPDDVKQVVKEVSEEYMATVAPKVLVEREDLACGAIESVGGTITVFKDEQVAEWQNKVRTSVLEGWRKRAVEAVGSEDGIGAMEKAYLGILEEQSGKVSYRDGMMRCAERLN